MRTAIQASPQRAKRGVALVIVISLIAMLTVVTVALLLIVGQSTQRTAGEVAAHQSESLAQTAFEIMLGDLGNEMERGSASFTDNKLADGSNYRLYDMTGKRQGMRVTSSVMAGAPGAGVLVKQSQATLPFHSWPPAAGKPVPLIRSSSVGTESGNTPINPALWLAPKFLAPAEIFSGSTAPRWVYLARNGSNPTAYVADLRREKTSTGAPNPSFVLGRYAYNLYETSGMLDINVAGFPTATSSVPEPTAARVGDKGSQLFADISILPGMSVPSMDKVSRWRHQWSTDAKVNDTYVQRSEGGGWRSMFANDNAFLSRQDLLSFWKANAMPNEALPFLTHFSRDLDAPSFRPDPSRPRIKLAAHRGGNDAFGLDDVLNPDLQAYNSDRQGPLVQRRFALERLKYVATPKTSAPLDAKTIEMAEKYFGLRWDPAEGVWLYVHARPNGSIATLALVPLDREPNLFELLRAAINVGSLGRQQGTSDVKDGGYTLANGFDSRTAASKHYSNWNNAAPKAAQDASVDLQILQIGANMIDQFDEDSFPTTIRLNKVPSTGVPFYVSGKEDVPYAVMTRVNPYRGKTLPGVVVYNHNWATGAYETVSGSKAYEINATMQVRLWRPHQPVDNYDGPVNFRIRTEHADPAGGSKFWTWSGWRMPLKEPTMYEITHWGHHDTDDAKLNGKHPSITAWDKSYKFKFEHTWGGAKGPPPEFIDCPLCGTKLKVTGETLRAPITNAVINRITSGASIVSPDMDSNTGSQANNSPQSNGDYTFWGGPDYSADGRPKLFTGAESIIVNVPYARTAFREPQLVHSVEHGLTAGYSVTGSMVETQDGDLRTTNRLGLPAKYTRVAGFLISRSVSTSLETGYNASRPYNRDRSLELRLGQMHFRSGPIDVIMEYQVPGTNQWRLYQRSEFGQATLATSSRDAFGSNPTTWVSKSAIYTSNFVDPRTTLWGGIGNYEAVDKHEPWNLSEEGRTGRYEKTRWTADGTNATSTGNPTWCSHPLINAYYGWNVYNYEPGQPGANPGNDQRRQNLAVVENDDDLWLPGDRMKRNFSYKDPDEVLRYGMAMVNEYKNNQFLGNPLVSRHSIGSTGLLTKTESYSGRPKILNRAFRSVGELGYVFRGTPWRDIEFLHPTSPDAALLDLFCVNEEVTAAGSVATGTAAIKPPVVAGRVNLNTAGVDVIAALLKGSSRDNGAIPMDTAEARKIATVFVNAVRGTTIVDGFQPMVSKAELISQPKQPIGAAAANGTTTGLMKRLSDEFASAEDRSIKDRRQVVSRALSSGTTVRAWNFMLDLVVQSGRLSPKAVGLADFNAAAERRYWVHFSVDRLTGKLLDVRWERVTY
jgi:hypothetical protein